MYQLPSLLRLLDQADKSCPANVWQHDVQVTSNNCTVCMYTHVFTQQLGLHNQYSDQAMGRTTEELWFNCWEV